MSIFRKSCTAVLACAATLAPWRAAAQFQGLTTTSNGSTLYFYSSTRQSGTAQTFHSKIFRWDAAGGIRAVAEVQSEGQSDGCVTNSYYQLHQPQVSADGTVFAYTASRPAPGGRLCPPVETNQAIVELAGNEVKLDGTITLSPNGRYAITTPLAAATSGFHIVTDLASGVSHAVAGGFHGPSQAVTNDGTIVTASGMAIVLTDRNGGTRLVQTRQQVDDVIVDPSGKTLVYVTRLTLEASEAILAGHISSIDLTTGLETQLTTNFAPANPAITSDAATVFFTDINPTAPGFAGVGQSAGPQLYAIGIGGAGLRQISHEADGFTDAAVSGDGLVAYGVTGGSRLVRIDVSSGISTELAPATPLVDAAYVAFAPTTVVPAGAVVTLTGTGLSSARRLTLCGQTIPITAAPMAQFQVPLNFPEGPCQVVVDTDSSLEHGIDLVIQKFAPQFIPVLIHQDFSGLITEASPSRPGEVIVAYMTGLGPVNNDGQVMPGLFCRLDGLPAAIQYAGAAPGFTGFYQVNVVVPNVAPGSGSLSCGWDTLMLIASTALWVGQSLRF